MPKKPFVLDELPHLWRQIMQFARNGPLVEHAAELFNRSGKKSFFLSAEFRLGVSQQFVPVRAPLNNSPSHHTVPASSASCSVCETCGRILRKILSNRSEMSTRRTGGTKRMTPTIRPSVINKEELKIISLRKFARLTPHSSGTSGQVLREAGLMTKSARQSTPNFTAISKGQSRRSYRSVFAAAALEGKYITRHLSRTCSTGTQAHLIVHLLDAFDHPCEHVYPVHLGLIIHYRR